MSNRTAFLDMIAYSEGTAQVPNGDRGYCVIVGGELFTYYGDHPRKRVWIESIKNWSTAAGRYQLLARYFDSYRKMLVLADFSPMSQDLIALQQIRERGALDDIDAGRFASAVAKVSNIWASLPGSKYGQRTNPIEKLQRAYVAAGGSLELQPKEDL